MRNHLFKLVEKSGDTVKLKIIAETKPRKWSILKNENVRSQMAEDYGWKLAHLDSKSHQCWSASSAASHRIAFTSLKP